MNKKNYFLLCGALALLYLLAAAAHPLLAQTSTTVEPAQAGVHHLTLSDAVSLALKKNRQGLLAETDVSRAAAEHKESKSPFRPQIFLGSGAAATKGFPLSIEGSAPSIFPPGPDMVTAPEARGGFPEWLPARVSEMALPCRPGMAP